MIDGWGSPYALGFGGWSAAVRDLDQLALVEGLGRPALPVGKPRLECVCPAGHSLVEVFLLPGSDVGRGLVLAIWLSTVYCDGPEGVVMERQPHGGLIPHHVVGVDRVTGRPILGGNIGGVISAECRCGRGAVHTREVERWRDEGRTGRVVIAVTSR